MPSRPPILRLLSSFLAFAALSACGGGGPSGPGGDGDGQARVAVVEVAPGADTLTALGETRGLQAVARDAQGNEVTGVSFSWSSSDKSVAAVDAAGVVTAEGNGTAEITATASGVGGSAELAVLQRVETVAVSPQSATLTTVGATQEFSASAMDANGNPVEGAVFVWDSEDPTVATVDRDGAATSRGPGQTAVSATAQDVPAFAALTVNQEVDRLAFREQPTDAPAGDAIDPAVQVEVLDADGNRVEEAEIPVTLGIGANPGGGSLGGTKTVNAVAGVATFSGLWVDAMATGYTLAASTPGTVTGAESAAFEIGAGPTARLAFTGQPTDATAGQAISPDVEVEIQDAFGNPVSGATHEVSISLAVNSGGGTLSGNATSNAVDGVASFASLSVERAAAGYRLQASAASLSPDVSDAFTVISAAAAELAFLTQPSAIEGREAFTPAPEVAVRDGFGNTVTSSSADVTLSIGSDPTGGDASVQGTATVAASGGVATFADASVDLPGDSYTLRATASGLDDTASDPFAVHLTFVQISAGQGHTCGVTVADRAYCWGLNSTGQLGDGTTADRVIPVAVASSEAFEQVSAGVFHTCGTTTGNEVFCWGWNSSGQLGDGSTADSPTPVSVASAESFTEVSAGREHTCGLTAADEIYCWGLNSDGRLGDNTTTDSPTPVAVSSGESFAGLDAGARHTCALNTAGEPLCWGRNAEGQIGDASTTDRSIPTAVSTGETFVQVTGGGAHTCGVADTGDLYCWGSNSSFQLGDGTSTLRTSPVAVSTAESFVQVSAGWIGHTCAVNDTAETFCWGENGLAELGSGATVPVRTSPFGVFTTDPFAHVSAGGNHTCGVSGADEAFCWGANSVGNLGDGTTLLRSAPVRVVQ